MYNRTLNRPMFRRGGRAGGGIMTGIETPKRGRVDGPGSYAGTKDEYKSPLGLKFTEMDLSNFKENLNNLGSNDRAYKLKRDASFLKEAIGDMPEYKPYPYKASDFFMGLGANILAQPGGQPIFQTIGQAGINPLKTLSAQNVADYGNKQKFELGKYQENKDLIMAAYKNLSEEDKDALINRAEQMVKAGRFETIEEALQVLVPTYSKDESPEEILRKKNIRLENIEQDAINSIKSQYKGSAAFSEGISDTDARTIYNFEKNIAEGKYEGVYHDPNQLFIDDSEVGRGTTEAEKRLIIRDYNPEQTDYKEGRIYIDFITKIAYVKQGQYFIPYEDYISETISTD